MHCRRLVSIPALAATLALSFAGTGWSRDIRGRVVSPEGKPVAEAVILHRPSGLRALSGPEGDFLLRLDAGGKLRLAVIHPGFLEEEVAVPRSGQDRPLTIVLVPLIRQREEVVVTALRYPEPSMKVPAASSVLSAETLNESMTSNLTRGMEDLVGVASLGTGGFSLVPVIRGLTRNRVLFLVDSARISSDRRTGPSASFVHPQDMSRVEVLRSPSSVFYGSDAIGGVFQVFLKEPGPKEGLHGSLNARYGSVNGEKGLGLALSGKRRSLGFYLSLQGQKAGDYSNSAGTVPRSGFGQWSLLAKLSHKTDRRQVDLSFLRTRGLDIGKPARDSLTRPTWYPRENHNLLQVHWLEKNFVRGELSFSAYINPNFLETQTDRMESYKTRESFSRTQGTDFGLQLSFARQAAGSLRLNIGMDLSGRYGVEAENKDTSFDSQGTSLSVSEETPYAGGSKLDLGFFLSADFSGLRSLDIVAGLRWDRLRVEADPGGQGQSVSHSDSILTGFAAASYHLSGQLVLFANLARAYRAPTLSERFYTGITGRGFIISQPGLSSEKSLSFDAGIKFVSTRFFSALYGFLYDIDGLIERYLVAEKTYTYGNVDRGRIRGLELEAEWFPLSGWKIFGHVSAVQGTSMDNSQPLNDIPPVRILAGTRLWVKRLSLEVSARHLLEKTNPGPAEIRIPACTLVDIKTSFYLPPSFNLHLLVSNAFNVLYLGRPDPDAPQDPGRNVSIGLNYSF